VSEEEKNEAAEAEAPESVETPEAETEAAETPAPKTDTAEAAEPAAEEAPAGETAAESVTPEPAAAEPESGKKPDLPPGADLEPISIEPEAELSAEERARIEAEEEERAEREAAAEEDHDVAPFDARKPVKLAKDARFIATGKRKSSVARVILRPGNGKITINDREIDEYFPRDRHRAVIASPLVVTGYHSAVDARIRVHGGGISGQAGAVRHGIARALTEADPELRSELKRRGFLTRDARAKERRKAGLKKARKRPQFSKR